MTANAFFIDDGFNLRIVIYRLAGGAEDKYTRRKQQAN
jgi:hypothetical protein